MSNIGNPFESTQPARQFFVGRRQELLELNGYLDTVKTGGSTNLFMVGGGGDGKTSFLYKIKEEAINKKIITAVITIGDGMQPDDVIYQMLEESLDEISKTFNKKEYYEDFQKGAESTMFRCCRKKASEKTITSNDLKKDLEFISDSLKAIGGTGVVFCFDEGQRLKNINGGAMFATIRGAIQAIGGGFMIVVAALENIIPEIAEGYVGVDRFFPNTLTLGPFENENVALSVIERRLEGKTVVFPQEVSEAIVIIAENRPKYIIDIAHDIYANAIASKAHQANSKMLKDVIYNRYASQIKGVVDAIGELKPSDLLTIRKVLKTGDKVTAKDIARLYCQENDDDCISRMEVPVAQELQSFVDKRLFIHEVTRNSVRFFIASGLIKYILENELNN